MNDVTDSTQSEGVHFFQGSEEISSAEPIEAVKQKITELSNLKNVSFLLGAGTSSDAIPSMKAMQEEISSAAAFAFGLSVPAQTLFKSLSGENLEDTLGVLYAKKYYPKIRQGC